MKQLIKSVVSLMSALRDVAPLVFRLILAYGFWDTGMKKLGSIDEVAAWFGNDLGIPFPLVNAYLAALTEVTGTILLTLGLATRFISIPLMFVMIVAIATVHWNNGFTCGKNGFEIPFYYFWMLFSLMVGGAGRISVDHLIKSKCCTDPKEFPPN